MGARGPAPKLRVVREREGNPAKRPLPEGVRLPPTPPSEPDWTDLLPTRKGMRADRRAEVIRARRVARARWRTWVRWLGPQGILSPIDLELEDAALIVAEIDACRRDVALNGRQVFVVDIGWKANRAVAQLTAARASLRPYIRDFGLSPLARDALNPREAGGDPDDLFDG
jgi:hypothetical protein